LAFYTTSRVVASSTSRDDELRSFVKLRTQFSSNLPPSRFRGRSHKLVALVVDVKTSFVGPSASAPRRRSPGVRHACFVADLTAHGDLRSVGRDPGPVRPVPVSHRQYGGSRSLLTQSTSSGVVDDRLQRTRGSTISVLHSPIHSSSRSLIQLDAVSRISTMHNAVDDLLHRSAVPDRRRHRCHSSRMRDDDVIKTTMGGRRALDDAWLF